MAAHQAPPSLGFSRQEYWMEWVAISFSNAWKWKVNVKSLSHVRLLVTPQTVAYQAPLSVGFSRQEYWSGLLLPTPLSFLLVPNCGHQWKRQPTSSQLLYSWPSPNAHPFLDVPLSFPAADYVESTESSEPLRRLQLSYVSLTCP